MNAQQQRAEKERQEKEKEVERQKEKEREESEAEADKPRTSSNSSSNKEASPVVNGNADITPAESANSEQEVGTVCHLVLHTAVPMYILRNYMHALRGGGGNLTDY